MVGNNRWISQGAASATIAPTSCFSRSQLWWELPGYLSPPQPFLRRAFRVYLVYQLQQPGVCPTFFGHTGSLVSQDNDLTGHLPCPLKSVPSASPLLVYSSHLPSTPPTTTLTAMALTIILLIGSIQIAMPTVLSVTLTVGVQNSGDPSEAHA